MCAASPCRPIHAIAPRTYKDDLCAEPVVRGRKPSESRIWTGVRKQPGF